MTLHPSAHFTVSARDDGVVFVEINDSSGAQIANWTMKPDAAEGFGAALQEKARTARKIGPS